MRSSTPTLLVSALSLWFTASACAQTMLPADGKIKLDVVVSDASGTAVDGLGRADFTLLDNNQPARIDVFQAPTSRPDPAVELIIVLDEIRHSSDQIYDEEFDVKKFLKQNGGQLPTPTAVYRLTSLKFSVTPEPTTDGNALSELISAKKGMRALSVAYDYTALRTNRAVFSSPDPLASPLQMLGAITLLERRKPGRKIVVWIGNHGPVGEDAFDWVTEFSTRLREARITLNSVDFWRDPASRFPYEIHLEGAKSAKASNPNNLAIDVLAAQTGGQVLAEQDNNFTPLIANCVKNAGSFYSLSFSPAPTDRVDDYHTLKVEVNTPGLTAHTNTGYYDESVYTDEPHTPARRLTVAELEGELAQFHGRSDGEVAHELTEIALTERLSSAAMIAAKPRLPGKKSWTELVALANDSTFLDPPESEAINAEAPDDAARQAMLAKTSDYLLHAIPKLPDFYATRTVVSYQQQPMEEGQTWKAVIGDLTLHPAHTARATVLYRNGYEVVDTGKKKPAENAHGWNVSGTFGPILSAIMIDITRSNLVWNGWQKVSGGKRAVYRYTIPQAESHYQVGSLSILSDGNTRGTLRALTGYHGEIEIDPASGAVLRLTVQAELAPSLPIRRADIMVEYGPIEIGGKTCICLERSVSIGRFRSIFTLGEWGESLKLYGPIEKMTDDVSFANYHMFHGEVRILSGDSPVPEEKNPAPR